ncbi:MAG: sulfatase [Planctomycetes bacterium]|nr:sulfatase [Planctomycetota bacterium]
MRRSCSPEIAAEIVAAIIASLALLASGCSRHDPAPPAPTAPPAPPAAAVPPASRRNVVIVTLDTTRRDALGFCGRSPSITPQMDALAAESAVFRDAYTVTPLTLPAHASLLTGLHPASHHLRDNSVAALPSAAVTLAEVLKEQGYATGAGVAAIVLDAAYGLAQGFDLYRDPPRDPAKQRLFVGEMRGDAMVDQALRDLPADGPFLYWLHLFDAHYPYAAPGSAPRPARTEAEANADRRRLYFEEIAFLDLQVGRFLAALRARPDWSETIVVLAADHGESLLDGVEPTHGWFLYDATMRIPLLMRVPGAPPRAIDSAVSLVDVMPTLLELLGIARPDLRFDGESVADLVRGTGEERSGRAVAMESWYAWSNFGFAPMEACVQGGLKYVRSRRERLFDRNPGAGGEAHDLFRADDPRARALRARLDALAADPAVPLATHGVELDDARRAELLSLGYVDATVRDFGERPDFAALADPEDHVDVIFALERVTSAFSDGDAAGAAAQLRTLCELAPQSVFAHEQLGGVLIASRRPEDQDEAERHLRKAIELDFQRAKAHFNLGIVLMRRMAAARDAATAQRHRLGALEAFRRSLEVDASSPEALANVASLARLEADALPAAERERRLALYEEAEKACARFLAELPADHADRGKFEQLRRDIGASREKAAASPPAPGD